MKTPIKKTILPQIIISTLIAAAITAGIVSAATTIGTNISTGGTLTATGLATFGNASTTLLSVSNNLWSNGTTNIGNANADILNIRSGDWNLTSTATTTVTMANGLNFDSNTFVIDPNSGRVGIGTAKPQTKLDILGIASSTIFYASDGSLASPSITFSLDSDTGFYYAGTSGRIDFSSNGLNRGYWDGSGISIPGTIWWSNDSSIKIYRPAADTLSFQTNGSDNITINASGFIGVGTTTPRGLLGLNDLAGTDPFVVGSTTPKFIIKDSGNIGIGTASPTAPMDIYTSATTTIILDSGATTQGSCLKLKDTDGSGYTYCYVNNGALTCSTTSCE